MTKDGLDITNEKAYLTPFPLSPLFKMLLISLATQRQGPITKNRFRDEYDYVIVGGGSAGAVVAARLSEIPCVSVLLLEAGKSPPKLTDIPVVSGSFVQSDIDWKYRTVPQKHTGSELVGRRVIMPTGKALGGGSTINSLIANRGHQRNYDAWAEGGATGWSYRDVLPYFYKMEDNRDYEYVSNGYHGMGGPQTIVKSRYEPQVKRPLMHAAYNMGYQFVDVSADRMVGFYDLQSTMRHGQRCSTAKAYLVPNENRTNLDILEKAMVTRITIENGRAVGVEFDFKYKKHKVIARREVILSAGAINSAQLLMLSGIGPMQILNKFKIPVVADLPVGSNLQDQCGAFLPFELGDHVKPLLNRLLDDDNVQTYINTRSGPLAYTNGISLLAFLSNNSTGALQDLPDHELYFIELPAVGAKLRVGLTATAFIKLFGPYLFKPILVCMSQTLHPKSRGTVHLKAKSVYTEPDIDPNYMSDPQDVQDIVEGLKNCYRILTRPEMASVGAKIFNTTFPHCVKFQHLPDITPHLNCLARSAIMSVSHPVGTAKMGQPHDPSTVVDPELRVKSVGGLRVIDASVMPTIPWGNTNVPTIMIAEKASDMIKRTIRCPPGWK